MTPLSLLIRNIQHRLFVGGRLDRQLDWRTQSLGIAIPSCGGKLESFVYESATTKSGQALYHRNATRIQLSRGY